MREAKSLRILSFGYTRSLWDRGETNDNVRLRAYAGAVARYTHVVNSRRWHRLAPLQVTETCRAVATGGWTPLDNFFRLLLLGHRELKQTQYDVIQVQDPSYMGLVGWWLAHLHGIPLNVCVYGPNPYDQEFLRGSLVNRLFAPLSRFVLKRCAGVQVDGRLAFESLQAHGVTATKIRCKPMIPTDVGDFFGVVRNRKAADQPVTLLFAGRLVAQKNLPMLLRAFARVSKETKIPVRLRLVGQGPVRPELEAQVRAAGLAGAIELPGAADRAGMLREFAHADVFALSSSYEGYPRVLVEAAASGLPVVATRVGGADEMIVDRKTGYLVPVGAEDAFANALLALVGSPDHRAKLGAAGRAHAVAFVATAAKPDEQIRIWQELAK